jgi:hypothetical protein
MTLTADRNTPRRADAGVRVLPADNVKIFAGALVMLSAAGYATKGAATPAAFGIGRAAEQVDNSGGSDGDVTVKIEEGVFRWGNSSSTDEITLADVGKIAWVVDDETVAKTSNSGARAPAGYIVDVDAQGVHVRMGLDVLTAWRQGRKKVLPLRLTTIAASGTPVYRIVSPFTGLITKLRSIIEAAIGAGDATLTASIGATGITNGVITVTQAASAAGDKDEATPTAANYVVAGDELRVTIGGSATGASPANLTFEIDAE